MGTVLDFTKEETGRSNWIGTSSPYHLKVIRSIKWQDAQLGVNLGQVIRSSAALRDGTGHRSSSGWSRPIRLSRSGCPQISMALFLS